MIKFSFLDFEAHYNFDVLYYVELCSCYVRGLLKFLLVLRF